MDEPQGSVARERKQSSGDLVSRLKTRKLLGVGETDDGDVHRSKLSQILGHSDQLHSRLPNGTKEWQLVTAALYTCVGLATVLKPELMYACPRQQLAMRLYGCCLTSISAGYWMAWRSLDREVAQFSLLCALGHCGLQILVAAAALLFSEPAILPQSMCHRWPLLLWLLAQPAVLLSGMWMLRAMLRSRRRFSKPLVTNSSCSPAHQCHSEQPSPEQQLR